MAAANLNHHQPSVIPVLWIPRSAFLHFCLQYGEAVSTHFIEMSFNRGLLGHLVLALAWINTSPLSQSNVTAI